MRLYIVSIYAINYKQHIALTNIAFRERTFLDHVCSIKQNVNFASSCIGKFGRPFVRDYRTKAKRTGNNGDITYLRAMGKASNNSGLNK